MQSGRPGIRPAAAVAVLVPAVVVVLAGLQEARRSAHDPRVRAADDLFVLVGVVEAGQHAAHGLDAGPLLVVALDHGPGRVLRVRLTEHGDLRGRVVVPAVQRGQVHRAELPLPYRVDLPDREAGPLLAL